MLKKLLCWLQKNLVIRTTCDIKEVVLRTQKEVTWDCLLHLVFLLFHCCILRPHGVNRLFLAADDNIFAERPVIAQQLLQQNRNQNTIGSMLLSQQDQGRNNNHCCRGCRKASMLIYSMWISI